MIDENVGIEHALDGDALGRGIASGDASDAATKASR